MDFPRNPGAVVRHTPTNNLYVRDALGMWHRGDYSTSDDDFEEHLQGFANYHEVVSEGYVVPVTEPRNLGAVVQFGRSESKAVFDGGVWVARWANGGSTNVTWSLIVESGDVEVLSEGVH